MSEDHVRPSEVQYIKQIYARDSACKVTYYSGAKSTDRRVALFFTEMASRGADPKGIGVYISLARYSDPETDWVEAKRILKTFEGKQYHLRATP